MGETVTVPPLYPNFRPSQCLSDTLRCPRKDKTRGRRRRHVALQYFEFVLRLLTLTESHRELPIDEKRGWGVGAGVHPSGPKGHRQSLRGIVGGGGGGSGPNDTTLDSAHTRSPGVEGGLEPVVVPVAGPEGLVVTEGRLVSVPVPAPPEVQVGEYRREEPVEVPEGVVVLPQVVDAVHDVPSGRDRDDP